MTDPTLYTHQPLDDPEDQIRLFRYKRVDGAIQCEISTFDVLQTPPYKTLSYVWGPPSPNFDIFVGGKRLQIRANLFAWFQEDGLHPSEDPIDAIKIIARKNLFVSVDDEEDWEQGVDWMWVDQICIDQSNVVERNHQVLMMSRIYSHAVGVLIWLGDTSTKSIPRSRDRLLPSRFADIIAAKIKQLFQDEYFTRLWIVQEILLSPNRRVQWRGEGCIDWDVLRDLTDENQRNLLYSRLPFNTSSMLVHAHTPERKTLSVSIFKYCVNKCADPRDKVYGFMGLLDGKQDIVVDYRKSVHEVFLDVVKAFRETYLVPGFAQWQRSWPSKAKDYRTVLMRLASEMEFPKHQVDGLHPMLEKLWKVGKDTRLSVSHVSAMGFDAAGTASATTESSKGVATSLRDRWWYESEDKMCYFDCGVAVEPLRPRVKAALQSIPRLIRTSGPR